MHTCDNVRHIGPLIDMNSWSEVPDFANECEEADFWGSHEFGARMLRRIRRERGWWRVEQELRELLGKPRRRSYQRRPKRPRSMKP